MKVRHVILLVTCFLSVQAWALTPEPAKDSTVPTKTMIESPISSLDWKKQPEAIALEAQNKTIKEYHSTLTDTVYFALSLVGGVAALLVGASFLINFKLYETDKERINEKVASIKGELDIFRKSQLDFTAALRSELEANIIAQTEKAKIESIVSVQAQLEAYANRASSEMVGLRAEISSAAERNETKFESIQTKLDGLQAINTELRKMIAHVESIAREAEAEIFGIREYSGAKLIALSQALMAAVKSDQIWNVQSILTSIEETLRNLTDASKRSVTQKTLDLVKDVAVNAGQGVEEHSSKVLALLAEIDGFRSAASA